MQPLSLMLHTSYFTCNHFHSCYIFHTFYTTTFTYVSYATTFIYVTYSILYMQPLSLMLHTSYFTATTVTYLTYLILYMQIFSLMFYTSYFICNYVHLCFEGYFWHVTDFHYDFSYHGTQLSCNQAKKPTSPGRFGDFWCDSPWELVTSAINAMKYIKQDADFALWTG